MAHAVRLLSHAADRIHQGYIAKVDRPKFRTQGSTVLQGLLNSDRAVPPVNSHTMGEAHNRPFTWRETFRSIHPATDLDLRTDHAAGMDTTTAVIMGIGYRMVALTADTAPDSVATEGFTAATARSSGVTSASVHCLADTTA